MPVEPVIHSRHTDTDNGGQTEPAKALVEDTKGPPVKSGHPNTNTNLLDLAESQRNNAKFAGKVKAAITTHLSEPSYSRDSFTRNKLQGDLKKIQLIEKKIDDAVHDPASRLKDLGVLEKQYADVAIEASLDIPDTLGDTDPDLPSTPD